MMMKAASLGGVVAVDNQRIVEKQGGSPLPEGVRQQAEELFGEDF